jgi:plastocyanin
MAIAAVLALTLSSNVSAQGDCGSASYKLKVRQVNDRPVEVTYSQGDAENLRVCVGDTIEWQLVGQAKRFYVLFLDGQPFSGDEQKNSNNNGKIEVTISGPSGDYKYNIGIEGGEEWDPRIIVD